MTISFAAKGTPKGQPRARAYARNMGGKYVARMYDAGTADDWKDQIWVALHQELSRIDHEWTTTEPIDLAMVFLMPRPKSHFGKHGIKDSAPRAHTAKPDLDNLCKLVMDVVTRSAAVWADDSQAVSLVAEKRYANASEHPGCIVTISENKGSGYLPAYRLQRDQQN